MEGSIASHVAMAARLKLDLPAASLRDEHFYSCVALCIIDAVFSIGVKYEGTRRTVARWAAAQDPKWELDRRKATKEIPVSEFVDAMAGKTSEELSRTLFLNKQRTSTKNGILKAEAVRRFALAIREAGIDRFDDILDENRVARARAVVIKIPGQRSGISFSYFLLLAGQQSVKPDRMICKFVADAAGVARVTPLLAGRAVFEAADILKKEQPNIDVRLLDSEIWSYESAQARGRRSLRSPSSEATHPEGRPSVRAWKGERCPSSYQACSTLTRYGFRAIARLEHLDKRFEITFTDSAARDWVKAVYAFVINDEIIRIGSSKGALVSRMSSWSEHVTAAFAGDYRSTPKIEADIWLDELTLFGPGAIWARPGTPFLSPVHDQPISGYQDEETVLIGRHKPRLNRGAHR